jgi:membrane-anchored protein YejM (alkaline phosphatase superfamily)
MEESGLWDRTAVLVSADHGWRTALWRATTVWTAEDEAASHQDTMGVPFLLKLPGQTSGSIYDRRFNTVVTRALITGILNGQVTDAAAVAASIEGTGFH